MKEVWTNNGASILTVAIGPADTSLTVGDGSLFPDPVPGTEHSWLTLQQGAAIEIVELTARAGNVLTVVRAAQGVGGAAAVALSFGVGALLEQRVTAATLEAISDSATAVHAALTVGAHGMTAFGAGFVAEASASDARDALGLGTAAVQGTTAFDAAGAGATAATAAMVAHAAAADPHAGYIKADGTRGFSGQLTGALSVAGAITTASYMQVSGGYVYVTDGNGIVNNQQAGVSAYIPRDVTHADEKGTPFHDAVNADRDLAARFRATQEASGA